MSQDNNNNNAVSGRHPHIDYTFSLQNIFQILALLGVIATAFYDTQSDVKSNDIRVVALEKRLETIENKKGAEIERLERAIDKLDTSVQEMRDQNYKVMIELTKILQSK